VVAGCVSVRTSVAHPRCEHRSRSAGTLASVIGAAVALVAPFAISADQPTALPTCALRLSVEVTPDVPNPSDSGFLSSLLGDNAGYQLFLLRTVDDTHVVLQLQGPGEAERCQAVVDSMRNDGRVVSIDVS
jgi:hypothetical protein